MSGETILVVGGAGYIGTHMVGDLLRTGYQAVTLDNLSRGHKDLVPGGIFIQGNLGDVSLLDSIFTQYRISAVMHFAAYSLVGESVTSPLDYYRNNVAYTVELLAAMARHRVQNFIFSSTAAVYGEPRSVRPLREDDPHQPTNPYGATKLAVERMLADCAATSSLRYVSLRYFNAAGADPSGTLGERHDPETHLIPLILQVAAGERDAIRIFGTNYSTPDGTCVRDYVHVNDLTQAHLLALRHLLTGGSSAVYNLGNSRGHSVREVIDIARSVTGHAIPSIEADNRTGDPAILVADSGKIRNELGWEPQFESLRTIIETAWVWQSKESRRKKTSP
ncbi:MAG: UDP-glucose 4-epimerase GalE [Sulfuricaulis sp.]